MFPPAHDGLLTLLMDAETANAGWVSVVDFVTVHPLASVTTKVYEPALRFEMFFDVELKFPVPVQAQLNGAVPPIGLTEIEPVEPPWHAIWTTEVQVAPNALAGWVMTACADAVFPLASVTVTVYEPALNPVAVAPVCTGVLFQL